MTLPSLDITLSCWAEVEKNVVGARRAAGFSSSAALYLFVPIAGCLGGPNVMKGWGLCPLPTDFKFHSLNKKYPLWRQ